ncbi:unnamed protein product [Ectocarpus sp. 13 AM-2016]
MELRDFRARLMSKGLDGWGGGGGEQSGGGGGVGAGGASIERWAHPLVRPELGCLVIAKEGMFTTQQQYFYKAVALVIQHGDDGTVALILNRPTTFTMGDVCKGDLQPVPGMEDNVGGAACCSVRRRCCGFCLAIFSVVCRQKNWSMDGRATEA